MSKARKFFWGTLIVVVAVAAGLGYTYYRKIYCPNTVAGPQAFVHIPTGSSFDDVVSILDAGGFLRDKNSFVWVATRMKYPSMVLPGRYAIHGGMNNKDLVVLLRSGRQAPVQLVFNTIRFKQQLAARVAATLEADSQSVMNLLSDEGYLETLGLDTATCLSLFIPNTYEFYWNTSADQFMQRMRREYDRFWTADRKEKARAAGLSRPQVSVLASIVEQETQQQDEKPLIAGVYINRYRKGWKLEADPTLVYALGDFSVRRVLSRYKAIDSPYNTYLHEGLPPGPICIPSISSIDAVLNFTEHRYMYFCARHDFSGYHVFARSYAEHLSNARRFHQELNKRKISS